MVPIIEVPKKLQREWVEKTLGLRVLEDPLVVRKVKKIVEDVRNRRDKALLDYIKKFDGVNFDIAHLKVTSKEFKEAYQEVDSKFIKALRLAKKRIASFYKRERLNSFRFRDGEGTVLAERVTPLSRVGVYVPGGKASYPSSLLMCAVPAQVAGVKEIAVATPPYSSGKISPYVLVAASELGIKEIYKMGGAHAISALAFGTESVRKVDKIVGPGNVYVTLAKKEVSSYVGIDMLAGPSELVIFADESADPVFVASDMLSQAEHDEKALVVLITTSRALAEMVKKVIEEQLKSLSKKKIARASLKKYGKIFFSTSRSKALELIEIIAPEHLQLMVKDAKVLAEEIKTAGAIFIGNYTPVAIGDYIAGPSHVLPTSGTASFASPLGVIDFLKRISVVSCTKKSFGSLSSSARLLAEVEGLDAHVRAIEIRNLKNSNR